MWVEDCGSASVLQLRLAKISCCSSAVALSFSAFGPDDWTLQLSRVGRFGELAARARRSFSPPLLLRGAPAAAGGSLAASSPPPGTRDPGPWWFFCEDPTLRCADVQFGCFVSSLDVQLIAVSRGGRSGDVSPSAMVPQPVGFPLLIEESNPVRFEVMVGGFVLTAVVLLLWLFCSFSVALVLFFGI